MKKIDGILANFRVGIIVPLYLFVGFGIPGLIILIGSAINGFNSVPSIATGLAVFSNIASFAIFVGNESIIKTKLSLWEINDDLSIVTKTLFIEKVILSPFDYKAEVVPYNDKRFTVSMYFRLSIFDENNRVTAFSEKIENMDDVTGIKIKSESTITNVGIIRNPKSFPDILWEIFQELEKHPDCKNIGESWNRESESPFVDGGS